MLLQKKMMIMVKVVTMTMITLMTMELTHLKPTVVVVRGDSPVQLAVQPDPLHAGT